jgi:hypothetical protein
METEQEKKEKKWVEHMKKLYHKDTKGWKNEQWSKWWHKCMKIQGSLNPNKSGHYARNTCNEGKNLSRVHFQLKEEEQIKNNKKMIKTLSNFFGLKEGGSKKSRKSKASQKSRKVKSKSRKSKASQKSRQSRKQSKRLEREIQLSKEMSKRMSKKTPMIASSHGISLLKRSKRNMSKGRPLASARDFLLATSILTAALSPYDPHPMAKKSQIAPDTQVHLDWHKGQFPDKELTSKQYKKLMKRSKRGKRLATIKEGGGGKFSKKCEGYAKLKTESTHDDLPIKNIEDAKAAIKEIVETLDCKELEEGMIETFNKPPYLKENGEHDWVRINANICEMQCPKKEGGRKKNRKKRTKRRRRKKRTKKSRKMRGGDRLNCLNTDEIKVGKKYRLYIHPDGYDKHRCQEMGRSYDVKTLRKIKEKQAYFFDDGLILIRDDEMSPEYLFQTNADTLEIEEVYTIVPHNDPYRKGQIEDINKRF